MWILSTGTDTHKCEPNRTRILAESLKSFVNNDSAKAVGIAARKIRDEASEEFGEDEEFYDHLISKLGTHTALEKQ